MRNASQLSGLYYASHRASHKAPIREPRHNSNSKTGRLVRSGDFFTLGQYLHDHRSQGLT